MIKDEDVNVYAYIHNTLYYELLYFVRTKSVTGSVFLWCSRRLCLSSKRPQDTGGGAVVSGEVSARLLLQAHHVVQASGRTSQEASSLVSDHKELREPSPHSCKTYIHSIFFPCRVCSDITRFYFQITQMGDEAVEILDSNFTFLY